MGKGPGRSEQREGWAGLSTSFSSAHLGNSPPGGIFQNSWSTRVPGSFPRLQFLSHGKGKALIDSPKGHAMWRGNSHFIPSCLLNIHHQFIKATDADDGHMSPPVSIYRRPAMSQAPCARGMGKRMEPLLLGVHTRVVILPMQSWVFRAADPQLPSPAVHGQGCHQVLGRRRGPPRS